MARARIAVPPWQAYCIAAVFGALAGVFCDVLPPSETWLCVLMVVPVALVVLYIVKLHLPNLLEHKTRLFWTGFAAACIARGIGFYLR